MLEVHKRIHEDKKQLLSLYGRDVHINLSSERDSITRVANIFADEAKILCFDE